MAVIPKTSSRITTHRDSAHVATWASLANGDSGEPLEMPGSSDRSAQVTGTFGAGGNCRIEGSNDGTNYAVLTDSSGDALDITAARIAIVMELTRFIRPRITAGDGTTSLTVSLMVKR